MEDSGLLAEIRDEPYKEYEWPRRGLIQWIEQEVLFHPYKWYTKALSVILDWLVFSPTLVPVYQVAFIYYASQWIGLGGWEWWQIAIKVILLVVLWVPAIFMNIWAAQCAVGENGITDDDL